LAELTLIPPFRWEFQPAFADSQSRERQLTSTSSYALGFRPAGQGA